MLDLINTFAYTILFLVVELIETIEANNMSEHKKLWGLILMLPTWLVSFDTSVIAQSLNHQPLEVTITRADLKRYSLARFSNRNSFLAGSVTNVEANFLNITNDNFLNINSPNQTSNLHPSYQIAQNRHIQNAVNVIHKLRQEGKITVGTDDTKIFGQRRVSTTKSGRGPYSNWVTITIIPEDRGYNFVAIGENAYRLHSIYANGSSTLCPSNCPVYSGQ